MAKRIIILGGGTGGTMAANSLASVLEPEINNGVVELLMISDSPKHYYRPGAMYVAFDKAFGHEFIKEQKQLLDINVDFVVDPAVGIDFKQNKITGQSGKSYGYDYLVLATGCVVAPERIPGLKEAGDWFYTYEGATKLAKKYRDLKEGKVLVTVNFPKTPNIPHQCGIAPVETTIMLSDYMKEEGRRDMIDILYTYPTEAQAVKNGLFLQKPTSEVLPVVFDMHEIGHKHSFTLKEVDPVKKIAYSEEGGQEEFDILMSTPPFIATEVIRNSGISRAMDDEGWVPTDRETLKVKGLDNVYALGDTVDLPISKAGGSIHNQAPVLANNIAGDIRIGKPVMHYDGRVIAVAQMGLSCGMPLWYDYQDDVAPTPASKIGNWMRLGFNKGFYWAAARGMF